jgi:Fic family protein
MTDNAGGRPMASPTPDELIEDLTPGEPYTIKELSNVYDTNHQTIRNRIETLLEEDAIIKKSHSERVTTYRLPNE